MSERSALSLQDWHDRARQFLVDQPVIALDGQPLVIGDRQPSALQRDVFTHVILGNGCIDLSDSASETEKLARIISHVGAIAAVADNLGESPAIDEKPSAKRLLACFQAID